jgi:hypothetical protein
VLEELRGRGHAADTWEKLDVCARGQIIRRLASGAYIAASDHGGDVFVTFRRWPSRVNPHVSSLGSVSLT